MTDANGSTHTTAFTYDGLDRLVTTTYPDTSAETATYDADGNVLTHTTRASATLHYGYDTLNRLVTKTAGATPVACDATPSATPTVSYRYDLAGRLIGVCDNSTAIQPITGMAGSAVFTTSTGYDALSHPTNVAYSPVPTALSPTLASPVVFTHAYNAVNQRVGQTVSDNAWISYPSGPTATTGYTANTLNQYTCVGLTAPSCTGVVPTYDGNGNLTYDGTHTLGYDAENRLTSASASGLTATYAYDARGRRKAKTVNGTTTVFVTDADNREVLEYDGSSGTVLRWYAYGLGPNDVLAQTTPGATPARATFIPDLQGSIIGSMTTAGVLTSFAYRPYGSSTSPPAQFGYTGQRIDAETALYYYRARMYSSAWGRFLQPDPSGVRVSTNLYEYALNAPLDFIDPTGEIGNCTGAQCAMIPQVLVVLQTAAANTQPGSMANARLTTAAAFLSGPKVNVTFGNMTGGYGGSTVVDPRSGTVDVTINTVALAAAGVLNPTTIAGSLIHEGGGHGADMLALGISAPTSVRQETQLEYSAYSLEQTFYQALGQRDPLGLWQPWWSPLGNQADAAQALTSAINQSVEIWTRSYPGAPPPHAASPDESAGAYEK